MASSNTNYPDNFSATKLTYLDGRVTTITLRRCKLVVTYNGDTHEHVFDKEAVTIGAMDDNDLVLDDETVSRNHCRISLEGDNFIITDLDSTNGTFVNRVRVREAYLRADSVISVGKTELRFVPIDESLKIIPSDRDRYGDILGKNQKMREIFSVLEKISQTDATVVIEGETGTGKEVVARTLHQQSRRASGPFIVFDCGAVPENLIESELFGHEKGAFTGAVTSRQGVFEMANGGTVFLDELGELAIDLQPRLLRVLEQREVRRVGGSRSTRVDVRIVAATNRRLEEEVKAGRFREDLFYRLSVVRVQLPSLSERKEDIPLLINNFLRTLHFNKTREGEQKVTAISPTAMDRLMAYDWPGNVRELVNVVERAVSFADTDTIQVADLPEHVAYVRGSMVSNIAGDGHASEDATRVESAHAPTVDSETTYKEAKDRWLTNFERDYIRDLLRKHNHNISHAARAAEIDRKYFRKLMSKYGIDASGEESVAESEA